jgi:hypothetical protein
MMTDEIPSLSSFIPHNCRRNATSVTHDSTVDDRIIQIAPRPVLASFLPLGNIMYVDGMNSAEYDENYPL